ncbi:hypothetical protein B0T14DRAFT_559281 [Immersiella caudata]|uniref:Uncharacterized protein n=1 Tax=Immersiella caudata TaxID=314043 RepID=A0AA39XCM2_9PEZI|nr:hypothetical protein B0T14DRAFT_559281 [Immersiella caudata]
MAIRFTIEGLPEMIRVQEPDAELLKQWSPEFKALIDNRQHPTDVIPLSPSEGDGIDVVSLRYILENIGLEAHRRNHGFPAGEQPPGTFDIVDLSGQCNALHRYKFDISSPFSGLWGRLSHPWTIIPQPEDEWCWRLPPRNDIPRHEWPHYANAAWVLGQDVVFSDAISSIVFDTKFDKIVTSVSGLKSMQEHRAMYMERLFLQMVACIRALTAEFPDIGQKVQRRILDCPHLRVYLSEEINHVKREVIHPWERSRDHLMGRTIYGFALQVDMALLKGTPDEYKKQDYATFASLPSGQTGPRAVTRPHFRAMKAIFGPSDRYVEEVKKILDIMNETIIRDRARLRDELLELRGETSDGGSSSDRRTSAAAPTVDGGVITEETFRKWQFWSQMAELDPDGSKPNGQPLCHGALQTQAEHSVLYRYA